MSSSKTPLAEKTRSQIGVGGFRISQRAKELVMQTLDSNRLTAGPMMADFEKRIAESHASRYALMCNSGTSALHIALAALKEKYAWRDGDEVLVPAVTFVATANVVLYNNLTPVFVDVEREFYDIDPAKIEEQITPRTRAIMPVHIGGLPCDMDPILELAGRYGLRVVEDSAECMFVRYKGRPVGSFGDIGCFSTYAAHIISTGVGGLCVTSDPELIVLLKSLMNHGRDARYIRIDDDAVLHGSELFEVVQRRFRFSRLGHSFRATEMEAAIGLAQFEEREQAWNRRRDIVARLNAGLSVLQPRLQLPTPRPRTENAYMFYPIVVADAQVRRDDLIQHLEDRQIETRYLLPLINQPLYRDLYPNLEARFPVASWLNENAFYIGCHPEMSNTDVDYVIGQFHAYFGVQP